VSSSRALFPRAQRPLSITIIGLYMLFGACLMPSNIFTQAPAFLMGAGFRGWRAILFFVVMGTLDAVIGIALLRLAPWSRMAAIYFFVFKGANTLLTFVFPGSRARFEEGLKTMRAARGQHSAPPSAVWFAVGALGVVAVVLWFLITRKEAFFARAKPQVSSPPIVGGAI